jgi:hypothetical protein
MTVLINIAILAAIIAVGAYAIFLLEQIRDSLNTVASRLIAFEQAVSVEGIKSGQLGFVVNHLSRVLPDIRSNIGRDM